MSRRDLALVRMATEMVQAKELYEWSFHPHLGHVQVCSLFWGVLAGWGQMVGGAVGCGGILWFVFCCIALSDFVLVFR